MTFCKHQLFSITCEFCKAEKQSDTICMCGDQQSQHIDGSEQCAVPECGCKEFEEKEIEEECQ